MKHSTPEKHGISSAAVSAFIDILNKKELPMHSCIMARGSEIIAETYWKPFDKSSRHRLYSCSKSFVSIAIGLLIEEGKLRLDDHIVSFFPEKCPEPIHPYLQAATVRHLLMMAGPHDRNAYSNEDTDWVATYLQRKPEHWPGTVFTYDTSGTVMLNAIVEKLSGKNLVEYLREKLFDPMGIGQEIWCVERPEGGAWGGSGMMLTAEEFAEVANVVMHYGKFEGKQLLPEQYLREATSKQIDNRCENSIQIEKQGYGYKFWMTQHNGFAFVGMGAQLGICFPDKDFVLITTADTQGIAGAYDTIFDAFCDTVYPYLESNAVLPENAPAYKALREKIDQQVLFSLPGASYSPLQEKINGREFQMDENPMGISKVSFTFENSECVMHYTNKQGDCAIRFGFGCNVEGEFPQKGYYRKRIGQRTDRKYRCLSSAAWSLDKSLQLCVQICDWYFGNLHIDAAFADDHLTLHMTKTAEWFLNEYQGFATGIML